MISHLFDYFLIHSQSISPLAALADYRPYGGHMWLAVAFRRPTNRALGILTPVDRRVRAVQRKAWCFSLSSFLLLLLPLLLPQPRPVSEVRAPGEQQQEL